MIHITADIKLLSLVFVMSHASLLLVMLFQKVIYKYELLYLEIMMI